MGSDPIEFTQMMGLPASGKSMFVKETLLYDDDREWTVIDTDAIRYETGLLNAEGKDAEGNEETCIRAFEALKRGENVLLDAPGVTAMRRAMLGLCDLIENSMEIPVERNLVVMRVPIQVCLQRNANREKPYPEELFQRHYVHFEKGLTEIGTEGWDNIYFQYGENVG